MILKKCKTKIGNDLQGSIIQTPEGLSKVFQGVQGTCGAAKKISMEATHRAKHRKPPLRCKCPPTQWGFSKKPPCYTTLENKLSRGLAIKGKRLYNLYRTAPVAQWIERLTTNQKVGGSSPSWRNFYFPFSKGAQYAGG
jgi:hypothetical protein